MTDHDIDAAIATHEAAIDALRGLKLARAPDAPPVAPAQAVEHLEMLTDLIEAGAAAALARRAKSTVGAWCRKNAIDGEKGFAIKLSARAGTSRSRGS